MTRDRFDIAYNEWLQQVEVSQSDSAWTGIQDELDAAETWEKISARLDELKPQKARIAAMQWHKFATSAAAIILLTILPSIFLLESPTTHPPAISNLTAEPEAQEGIRSGQPHQLAAHRDATPALPEAPGHPGEPYRSTALPSPPAAAAAPPGETAHPVAPAARIETIAVPRISGKPADNETLPDRAMLAEVHAMGQQPRHPSEPGPTLSLSLRVTDAGLVFGHKNTWLLNYETFNGLNPTKLGNTLFTFHQDLGASLTVELNRKHLFGLEFLWKSEAGQNYQQFINARFVNRHIRLNYLKLQAFYHLDILNLPGYSIVGGYMANLTMAEEMQGETTFSVYEAYRNFHYGLLAGYEIEIALSNRVMAKPGLRVSYSLGNIFAGDGLTPASFKRTRNLTAGFHISLSYRFSK